MFCIQTRYAHMIIDLYTLFFINMINVIILLKRKSLHSYYWECYYNTNWTIHWSVHSNERSLYYIWRFFIHKNVNIIHHSKVWKQLHERKRINVYTYIAIWWLSDASHYSIDDSWFLKIDVTSLVCGPMHVIYIFALTVLYSTSDRAASDMLWAWGTSRF